MTDSDVDELGPVDYVVVEFPADKADFSGEMATELSALDRPRCGPRAGPRFCSRRRWTAPSRDLRPTTSATRISAGCARWRPSLALLLAEEDVEAIGAALEPGTVAAVLVWENVWAAPFGSAIRRSGGQLVAGGRIPIQALAAALEADEANTKEGD